MVFLLLLSYLARAFSNFNKLQKASQNNISSPTKAELPLEGFFFSLNFLPWEFLLVKKLEINKTKTTLYTTFKTDIIKVVLVFPISNFFTNKKSQGRKLRAV